MAKVQITSAITLDGNLPEANNPLFSWIESNRKGFPSWREAATRLLTNDISFLSLINEKRIRGNDTAIYLAEATSPEHLSLIKGLFAYGLVDEVVLYVLPGTCTQGVPVYPSFFPISRWNLKSSHTFPNGICRLIYNKTT